MLEFLIVTPIVYLFYYIFMINKYDENGKLKPKKENRFLNKIITKVKSFIFGHNNEKDEVLLRGRKNKKIKEEKDEIKFPTEVEILIVKYHIDLSKVNYKKVLKLVGLMCSIDIGLILGIVSYMPIENIYIKILVGGVIMIPLILISYAVLGSYFKKKDLVIKKPQKKGKKKNV